MEKERKKSSGKRVRDSHIIGRVNEHVWFKGPNKSSELVHISRSRFIVALVKNETQFSGRKYRR